MSSLLYRIGHGAAQRPWRVIAVWLVVAVAVVAASSSFGRDLDDSFEVPGVDSQQAVELLSAAGSDSAGLTARVVVTPLDPAATLDSPVAQREVATVLDDLATLPERPRGQRPVRRRLASPPTDESRSSRSSTRSSRRST